MRTTFFLAACALAMPLAAPYLAQVGADPAAPATEPGPPKPPPINFTTPATARTLTDLVLLAKQQFERDGKKEFVPLVTEPRLRAAMQTALTSWGSATGSRRPRNFTEVEDICRRILQTGELPEGTTLHGFYGLGSRSGVTFDGLGLRLWVPLAGSQTLPGGIQSKTFVLPLLDLWYGMPPPRSNY